MHTRITLHEAREWDRFAWPDTEQAKQMRRWLAPLCREGIAPFIRNVKTQLYVLCVNQIVVPITVNSQEYDNSYLTSNYFLIRYLEEQMEKERTEKSLLKNHVKKWLLNGVGGILKSFKINQTVIVNNCLLTGTLYPSFTQQELHDMTFFLEQRFPEHILMFKGLTSYCYQDLIENLKKTNYFLFYTHNVFVYDPAHISTLPSKALYHQRRDRRLLNQTSYQVVMHEQLQPEDFSQMLGLYQMIYHSLHTKYSPDYTSRFVQQTWENQTLRFIGLKKQYLLKGIIGFYEHGGALCVPFFGYDRSSQDSTLLYRMLLILIINEAERRSLVLNDGAGGEYAKQCRGLLSVPEYVALYSRHLSLLRRSFWALGALIAKSTLSKIKFSEGSAT